MKISTKGRYALRLMLDLAMHDGYTPVKSISARQNLSEKYLEQLVALLGKSELVVSTRGALGGYRLAGPPEDITVGMVLRAVEGTLAPVACLESSPNRCERAATCPTLGVWEEIQHAVAGVVDHITLADLVERQKQLGTPGEIFDGCPQKS